MFVSLQASIILTLRSGRNQKCSMIIASLLNGQRKQPEIKLMQCLEAKFEHFLSGFRLYTQNHNSNKLKQICVRKVLFPTRTTSPFKLLLTSPKKQWETSFHDRGSFEKKDEEAVNCNKI